MTRLRIALGDLRHETIGVHSTYAPVAIEYIGSYLKAHIPDVEFEIRLYTRPIELFDDIDEWAPDVVALSNYLWNAELSNSVCEFAKGIKKMCFAFLAGLNFQVGQVS